MASIKKTIANAVTVVKPVVPAQWLDHATAIAVAEDTAQASVSETVGRFLSVVRTQEGASLKKNLEDRKSDLRASLKGFCEAVASRRKAASEHYARNLLNDLRAALLSGEDYRSGLAMSLSRAAKAAPGAKAGPKKAGKVTRTSWSALVDTLTKASEQAKVLKAETAFREALVAVIKTAKATAKKHAVK
jgi:hypothetical protein